MLANRGSSLPDWPKWCFLPMAGWYAIVSGGGGNRVPPHMIADVGRLAAIGTWRYSQGIYRFTTEMYQAIADTGLRGNLPSDVLMRLPEWCVYVETPDRIWLGTHLYGIWAHLESDANDGRRELRLLLDTEDALIPIPVHLGDWTVEEAVTRMINETARQSVVHLKRPFLRDVATDMQIADALRPLISLLLYLCSDEPEIDDDREPGAFPAQPHPRKTKQGLRWFPPDRPRIWTVGGKMAVRLREARQAAERSTSTGQRTLTPHIRRAHWHGFWTGPLDGPRRFSYHWLPPILVSGRAPE
ncbi:AcrVA2 family anti-CRISPR protein [Geobacter anodireducens]|uniref:AcrVA2 family anti-CRISPR protein n=1 Tax=Geobacter anodireducens TaxID=1340425 RepID=UPI001864BE6E|nr:hypothetical protein [Geobacter anodireducens]